MSGLEEWEFHFDLYSIEKENYSDFESQLYRIHKQVIKLFDDIFIVQSCVQDQVKVKNHDENLRMLVERNKEIKQIVDAKLEGLARQQNLYGNYKKDQKLLSQEIKDTHEAFLMAKKYYKKALKMYCTIEAKNGNKQTIFIQFFTESKKESENYSVYLLRDTKTGHYEFLNTKPKLPFCKEIEKRLKDSNDVPGAICCVRQAFLSIRANRKL